MIAVVDNVGVVGESKFEDGREVVQYRAPSGATSDAVLDQGNVELRVESPVDIGRPGEPRVRQGVVAALRAEGRTIAERPAAIDAAGEDFTLSCDGQDLPVQVVTVPSAKQFWRDVSQGSGPTSVTVSGAADWIYDAARAKSDRYSAAQKRSMILAVDAAHAAVIVTPSVVDDYLARYGDPLATFGFAGLCLVGPIDSRFTWVGTRRI